MLYIYYSASGNFDFGDLQKDITVYIPENDEMSITVYSETAYVDLDMSGFENTMESLYILSNGGKVSAKVDCADEVRISGQNEDNVPEANREFLLRANEIYDIGISASYARLDVAAEYIHSGEVGTVFNDLLFHADKIKRIKLQNSTGKTTATVRDFDSIDIETFEGATELTLSPDASFELTLKEKDRFNHKVSPKSVSVEFDGVKQDGLKYTVGSADKKLTVATDSTLRIIPLPTEG